MPAVIFELLKVKSKMRKDISERADIELLIEKFYHKLLNDPSIGYIFTDVAKIDLEHHLPILADFWESLLLSKNEYSNNTMKIHMDLNAKTPLTKEHFILWLKYFNDTLDELFEGDKTTLARQRATSIATVMQIKIINSK